MSAAAMGPRTSARVVEVVVYFGDTILDVRHVPERTRAGTPGCYAVGEGPSVDLIVNGEGLPTPERFVLVRACEQGPGFVFEFSASMLGQGLGQGQGKFITPEAHFSLASLVESGAATACGAHFSHPLRAGTRAILQLGPGPLCIYLRTRSAASLLPARRPLDKLWSACLGGSAGVLLAMIFLMLSMPEERQIFFEPSRFEQLMLPPPIVRSELEPDEEARDQTAESNENTRAFGNEEAPREHLFEHSGPKPDLAGHSPRSNQKPIVCGFPAWVQARDQTSNAGVLDFTGPYMEQFAAMGTGAYTPETDDRELWKDMTEGDPPEYSVGGIGLVSVDPKRGHTAEGVLGLGHTGLLGEGGYAHGNYAGFGSRRARRRRSVQHVRVVQTSSLGDEDTHVARRIVRAHKNELEACYRSFAEHNEISAGYVILAFVVSAEGRVLSSVTKRSEAKAPGFETCVNRAIKRWRFPKPHWGMAQFEQTLQITP